MELQEQQARAIVHEINTVLPQKINLMNKGGIIIASTDPERVQSFHGGAARIIQDNLDELRIHRYDEYPGARPGTNFMLQVEGEPIGVLGITGVYETILPLANVIRKMTELLVHEQEYQKAQSHLEYQQQLFLRELLEHSETFLSKEQVERASLLNIDLSIPRRIVVADFVESPEPHRVTDIASQLKIEAQRLDAACCVLTNNQMIVFLTGMRSEPQLYAFADKLLKYAQARGVDLCFGMDSPAVDNTKLRQAFEQARKALCSCHRKGTVHIKGYDEINMEIFADLIPLAAKREYVKKIFHGYSTMELADAIHTLECFFEHDGSITKTAAALYIHKNTLQQHLKKIALRTGYDPRSLRSSAVFYVVLYFYQDIHLTGFCKA